ncbi:MAG: hypothetical protein HC840_16585 [Leptolyngbyaceae cyanobacterium RM2_2_4]|nr:hypothetical protein [Leptolyngbyaceae cyanobacterium SM1_4_3]NJO50790.1 hypothetical protein [Leptolyngbyaceae cyanobacterium RM2_2_4]
MTMKDFRINQGWIMFSGSLAISLSVTPIANAFSLSAQTLDSSNVATGLISLNTLAAFSESLSDASEGIQLFLNQSPVSQLPFSFTTPPLPEHRQPIDATVVLDNGTAQVELVNLTGAAIDYMVVEHTDQRTLSGQSNVILSALPAPVVIIFQRQDNGLLDVQVRPTETPGVLQVTLDETTDFSAHRISMKIENDGAVFLN